MSTNNPNSASIQRAMRLLRQTVAHPERVSSARFIDLLASAAHSSEGEAEAWLEAFGQSHPEFAGIDIDSLAEAAAWLYDRAATWAEGSDRRIYPLFSQDGTPGGRVEFVKTNPTAATAGSDDAYSIQYVGPDGTAVPLRLSWGRLTSEANGRLPDISLHGGFVPAMTPANAQPADDAVTPANAQPADDAVTPAMSGFVYGQPVMAVSTGDVETDDSDTHGAKQFLSKNWAAFVALFGVVAIGVVLFVSLRREPPTKRLRMNEDGFKVFDGISMSDLIKGFDDAKPKLTPEVQEAFSQYLSERTELSRKVRVNLDVNYPELMEKFYQVEKSDVVTEFKKVLDNPKLGAKEKHTIYKDFESTNAEFRDYLQSQSEVAKKLKQTEFEIKADSAFNEQYGYLPDGKNLRPLTNAEFKELRGQFVDALTKGKIYQGTLHEQYSGQIQELLKDFPELQAYDDAARNHDGNIIKLHDDVLRANFIKTGEYLRLRNALDTLDLQGSKMSYHELIEFEMNRQQREIEIQQQNLQMLQEETGSNTPDLRTMEAQNQAHQQALNAINPDSPDAELKLMQTNEQIRGTNVQINDYAASINVVSPIQYKPITPKGVMEPDDGKKEQDRHEERMTFEE